jgi:hypothetical protein
LFEAQAINDKGVIVGTGSGGSIVWEADGSYWMTAQRFKDVGSSLYLTAVSSDSRFLGSIPSEEPGAGDNGFTTPVYVSGKGVTRLATPADSKSSEADLFYGTGYLGHFTDRSVPFVKDRGCIWMDGRFHRLQDCLAKSTEWQITKPVLTNAKGQIAVYVKRFVVLEGRRVPEERFGVLTPVK